MILQSGKCISYVLFLFHLTPQRVTLKAMFYVYFYRLNVIVHVVYSCYWLVLYLHIRNVHSYAARAV